MNVEATGPRTGIEVAEGLATDPEQRRRLVSYARSKFGVGEEDAEDLLQETLLELMRTEGLIHRPEGFAFRVFHTRCCNGLRQERVTRTALAAAAEGLRGAAPRPDRSDVDLLLRQGLSRVSLACRKLLTAHYVEGRSLRETAEALSLRGSLAAVHRLVNNCLRRLKRCLERP